MEKQREEDHVSHVSSRPVSTWSGVTPMTNGGAPLTAKTQSTLTHLLQQQNGNINLVSFGAISMRSIGSIDE